MAKFYKDKFDKVILLISNGKALRNAVKDVGIASNTFYDWINNDEALQLQYARATEERATAMVEDMLQIADDQENDVYEDEEGNEITNYNVIQRSRLRVDTRKWLASKLRPKKYGDSSQIKIANHDGKELKVNAMFNLDLVNVPTNSSTKEDI